MTLDERLSNGIIEDVSVMFEYMLENKMYDSMARCLSMVKPTYPKDKWQQYFNLWEDGQHKQKLGFNYERETFIRGINRDIIIFQRF